MIHFSLSEHNTEMQKYRNTEIKKEDAGNAVGFVAARITGRLKDVVKL